MTATRRPSARLPLLIALAVLLLAAAGGLYWLLNCPPPAQRAADLLATAFADDDYSFRSRATLEVAGAVSEYFDLSGRVEDGCSQVSGVILGQEAELSYDGGRLRRRLPGGEWQERKVASLEAAAQLYAELLPAAAFAYQGELAAAGCRRVAGGWAISLRPAQPQGWVGQYFCDAVYVVYCDIWRQELLAAELSATEKVNGQAVLHLKVEVD